MRIYPKFRISSSAFRVPITSSARSPAPSWPPTRAPGSHGPLTRGRSPAHGATP